MKSVKSIYLFVLLFFLACDVSINETIRVADGETRHDNLTTVNGSIIIGRDCEINGECTTVNGRVKVGKNSKVGSIHVINGSIKLYESVNVKGDVEAVNGLIDCLPGVTVRGDVTTINGNMDLDSVSVSRNVETYNGNITLENHTRVIGDVIVKGSDDISISSNEFERARRIKIEIENGSVVEGDIIIEDREILVRVSISENSEVKGKIDKKAEIIKPK